MADSVGSARTFPGFSAPAVGFDDPFAMLQACHERVQRTLTLLSRLRAHLARQGLDGPARDAARDVLRYFDIAAPLHHQDEELHVFPLLLQQHPTEQVRQTVLRLQGDHVLMSAEWSAARVPLQALVDGVDHVLTPGDNAALDRFAGRYSDHIAAEETIAYPAAAALLDRTALAAMGQEMASRRGVPLSHQK
jgi:hypothetical protein